MKQESQLQNFTKCKEFNRCSEDENKTGNPLCAFG